MRPIPFTALLCALPLASCQIGSRVEECNAIAAVLNEAPRFKVEEGAKAEEVARKFAQVSESYQKLAERTRRMPIEHEELGSLQKDLASTFDVISEAMQAARTARLSENPIQYDEARTTVEKATKKAERHARDWQRICK